MKFKVGDKVKVIERRSTPASYIRRIGVVIGLRCHCTCPYRVKFNDGTNLFTARELEKVE